MSPTMTCEVLHPTALQIRQGVHDKLQLYPDQRPHIGFFH